MAERGHRRTNGIPTSESRIMWGRVFSVRENWNGIGDGTSRNIVLTNPPDSGISMLTTSPNFAAEQAAFVEKIQNVTIDTAGTAITPLNKKVGDSRTSEIAAETGGSYSGGTSRGISTIGSNTGGGGAGAIGDVDLALEIPPGNNVQYRIESDSSGNDMSIGLNWIEEPV